MYMCGYSSRSGEAATTVSWTGNLGLCPSPPLCPMAGQVPGVQTWYHIPDELPFRAEEVIVGRQRS